MKYEFYTTSEKAWGAMLKAISSAQRSVYLEMYIFTDNTDGYDFFETLKQKSRQGVKVKIIIDSMGSNSMNKQSTEKLQEAGVEVLFFSYWMQRTHKKILIVDEKIAFIGGVNIHKLFKKWNDLQIRLQGPIAKSVIRSFARSYRMCDGKDPDVLSWIKKKNVIDKTQLWILEHWRLNGKRKLRKHYKESIHGAKKSIVIVTPYFAPHRWLIGALHQAILRGATVEIILPQKTDLRHMNRVNYFYMSQLSPLGIKFYLHKEMLHAKAMFVDDREGIVGSQNIDPVSFDYNLEAGVFFIDEKMVQDLKKILDQWKQNSIIFEPSIHKKTWIDYIISPMIRIFQIIIID